MRSGRASRRGRPAAAAASPATLDDPITGISLDDAAAYCDWTSGWLPDDPMPEEPDVAAVAPGRLGVWWDAGTERHKQVRDHGSGRWIMLAERSTRMESVGLVRAEVERVPGGRFVPIQGASVEVGVDVAVLGRLAPPYHLSEAVTRRCGCACAALTACRPSRSPARA